MSPITALGTTDHGETLAFSILKNVLTPTKQKGWNSIFGSTPHQKLPYNTTIPLYKPTHSMPTPSHATIALLESIRQADEHSYFHTSNHGAHSYNFAHFIGMSAAETTDLYYASLLHDIGKVFCSEIVSLPRTLTPDEKAIVEQHAIVSFVVLSACGYNDNIAYAGLFHHLTYNKQGGYPKIDSKLIPQIESVAKNLHLTLPSEKILDFASISQKTWDFISALAITDALDAAIDPHRPYKPPIKFKDVLNDFETSKWNWKTSYNVALKPAFEEYIEWLEQFTNEETD